jgi:hypothetical protein
MEALVGYGSDSGGYDDNEKGHTARDDDNNNEKGHPTKKRTRDDDDEDDEEEEDKTTTGRVRSFPHVEGNFATHVYVPIDLPRCGCCKALTQALAAFKTQMPTLQPCGSNDPAAAAAAAAAAAPSSSAAAAAATTTPRAITDDVDVELLLPRELHVSLSRVFPIRVEQKNALLTSLRRHLGAGLREAFDAVVVGLYKLNAVAF